MPGTAVEHHQEVLGRHDLVFAKAKCAIKATVVGAAVIVSDVNGLGGAWFGTPKGPAAAEFLRHRMWAARAPTFAHWYRVRTVACDAGGRRSHAGRGPPAVARLRA
jgi:hypothetical protein